MKGLGRGKSWIKLFPFRLGVGLGIFAVVAFLGFRDSQGATDNIGIASQLTSLRWTIEDGFDRMNRAEQFDDFKSVKLHYSVRDVRKSLNILGKRMRRAQRSGGVPEMEADIERLSKFIDRFRDLNTELEEAKRAEDIVAVRNSLRRMSRVLEPMEKRILGEGDDRRERSEDSARSRRDDTASPRQPSPVQQPSQTFPDATVESGHPGMPDFVISKVDYWRRSGLLGGRFLGIFPHVKNLSAGRSSQPIAIQIDFDKPRACRLRGEIGPHQELRTKDPCAYIPEDIDRQTGKMSFKVTLDAGGPTIEGRTDNNVCKVTYTASTEEEGTLPCVPQGRNPNPG